MLWGPSLLSLQLDIYTFFAINYFSKWEEPIALKEVKKENVVDFI